MPEETSPRPTACLRTIVADGDNSAAEHLQILLAQFDQVELVGTAKTGPQTVRMIDAMEPDLLLLSVNLPDMDGLAVAENVRRMVPAPSIVFVSSSRQFAVDAFDLAAVDYLLKPVGARRLSRTLQRVSENRLATTSLADQDSLSRDFWVPRAEGILRVEIDMIWLIEAQGDYVLLHVDSHTHIIHKTIKQVMTQLSPHEFIRIHRSTIVRRDRIKALIHRDGGQWSVDLGDGRSHHIGRTYLASVKALSLKT